MRRKELSTVLPLGGGRNRDSVTNEQQEKNAGEGDFPVFLLPGRS